MCFCCGETGVHEETQPARPGDHNLPRMPRPGLKPGHRKKDEPSANRSASNIFLSPHSADIGRQ